MSRGQSAIQYLGTVLEDKQQTQQLSPAQYLQTVLDDKRGPPAAAEGPEPSPWRTENPWAEYTDELQNRYQPPPVMPQPSPEQVQRAAEATATISARQSVGYDDLAEPERLAVENAERARLQLPALSELPDKAGAGEILVEKWRQSGLVGYTPFLGKISEAAGLWSVYDSSKRIEAGEATAQDWENMVRYQESMAKALRDKTVVGKAADILSDMVPFMGEILLSGPGAGAASKVAAKAAHKGLRRALEMLLVKPAVEGTVRLPYFTAHWAAETIDRMVPGLDIEEGQWIVPPPGTDWETAVKDAGLSTYVMLVSEFTGRPVGALVGRATKLVTPRKIGVRKFLGDLGYHSQLGEIGEEYVEVGLRSALTWSGAGQLPSELPSLDEVAAMGLAFAVPGTAGYAAGRIGVHLDKRAGVQAAKEAAANIPEVALEKTKETLLTPEGARQYIREHPEQAGVLLTAQAPVTRRGPFADLGKAYPELDLSEWNQFERNEFAGLVREEVGAATEVPTAEDAADTGQALPEDAPPVSQQDLDERQSREQREAELETQTDEALEEHARAIGLPYRGGRVAMMKDILSTPPPRQPGDMQAAVPYLRPTPMPEMVELANQLGVKPRITNLPTGILGVFRQRKGHPAQILIEPSTAANETVIAGALAHEIGHLTDYLPEQTMARGDLARRLRSILAAAKVGVGGTTLKRQATEELTELSKWWRGWHESEVTPEQLKYLKRSRELYADFVSVMLNVPHEAAARAPISFGEFTDHLDRKPQVLNAYLNLQNMLAGTPAEIAERRRRRITEGHAAADEAALANQEARDAPRSLRGWMAEHLLNLLLDRTAAAQDIIRPGQTQEAARARFLLDELFSIQNAERLFAEDVDRLREELATKLGPVLASHGYDLNDIIGEYLQMRRILKGDRKTLGNPYGFRPTEAEEQTADLRQKLGEEGFKTLEETMLRWNREVLWPVTQRAAAAGVYPAKALKKLAHPKRRDNYATFAVVKYIEGPDISPMLHEQVGTFEATGNAFNYTNAKFVSLLRLTQLNEAKGALITAMKKVAPGEVLEAEMRGGNPIGRRPRGMELVKVLEDGKMKGYWVPKRVAAAFKSHDIGALTGISRLMQSGVYTVFHPLYVTFSPGFLVANPFRDLRRTHINLKAVMARERHKRRQELREQGVPKREAAARAVQEIPEVRFGEVLRHFFASIPAARRRARGISDEQVRTLLEHKALSVPYTDIAAEAGEILPEGSPLEKQPGVIERLKKSRTAALRGMGSMLSLADTVGAVTRVKPVLAGVRRIGETQETASKVAGWQIVRKRGIGEQQAAQYVRKYVGTPDYMQRGLATPLTNSVWMYSKVRWNGLQADLGLAFARGSALSWWWNRAVWTLMPTTFTKLAIYGYFGAYLQELFGKIGDYFLHEYDVLPLGFLRDGDDDDEKAAFLTLPKDDVGRMLGRLWGRMIDVAIEAAGGETRPGSVERVASDLIGNLKGDFMPQTNPLLNMGVTWGMYASGLNPYDTFFGMRILSKDEDRARGWEGGKRMLSWTIDKFGVLGTVAHAVTGKYVGTAFEEGTDTTIEAKVRAVPGFSRLVRISDRGEREWQIAELEDAETEAARARLQLPRIVRKRTQERHLLNRLSHAKLSNAQRIERLSLNVWYSDDYLPTTRAIRDAMAIGDEQRAERWRARLAKKPEPDLALLAHQLGQRGPREAGRKKRWMKDVAAVRWWRKENGVSVQALRRAYQRYLYYRFRRPQTRAAYLANFDRRIQLR